MIVYKRVHDYIENSETRKQLATSENYSNKTTVVHKLIPKECMNDGNSKTYTSIYPTEFTTQAQVVDVSDYQLY